MDANRPGAGPADSTLRACADAKECSPGRQITIVKGGLNLVKSVVMGNPLPQIGRRASLWIAHRGADPLPLAGTASVTQAAASVLPVRLHAIRADAAVTRHLNHTIVE